jgi:hypothetical protein
MGRIDGMDWIDMAQNRDQWRTLGTLKRTSVFSKILAIF